MAGLEMIIQSDEPLVVVPPHYYEPVAADSILSVLFLGQSAELSRKNRVRGNQDGFVVGAPAFADIYASLQGEGVANIDFGMPDTPEFTWMFIEDNTDTLADNQHRPTIFGTAVGNPVETKGAFVNRPSSGLLRFDVYHDLAGATSLVRADMATAHVGPKCWMARCSAAEISLTRMYDMKRTTTAVPAGATRRVQTVNIRMGGRNGGVHDGTLDGYCGFVWGAPISDDDATEGYQALKELYLDVTDGAVSI